MTDTLTDQERAEAEAELAALRARLRDLPTPVSPDAVVRRREAQQLAKREIRRLEELLA